jgi:urocanate hydratase
LRRIRSVALAYAQAGIVRVMRHVECRYEIAKECAREKDVKFSMK